MRTEGKISVNIMIDGLQNIWLDPADGNLNDGHAICRCFGPDAADNAKFIRTAWNEWEERERVMKQMLETLKLVDHAVNDELRCQASFKVEESIKLADKILNPAFHEKENGGKQ